MKVEGGGNKLRFDNSFWDEDIGNYQGWETVARRLKDGRQVVKEYAEFLKQRAAIEEQLGKSLVKLAKSVTIREDLNPLRNVWEIMKSQTETSGLAHLKSAHQLSGELTKLSEISEHGRDKRRLKEESVRNHQQNVKVLWKRTCEAKRIYDLKCREEVASNQFYHQEVARCGKSSKEAEKAHSKYAKAKQTLDLCESSYQSSVTSIEEARRSWEKETEKSLVTFQSLEEDRLAHIRDSLWRVANISSLAAVADDLAAEEVRKTLESSNLDDAIQGFINENASGFKRPNAIIFQRQPTSSSHGMGRASDPSKLDTQSLIVGPVSTPTPSIDAGRETPAVSYRVGNSASMSSLRDLGFQSAPTPTYTTTMPRGPFLQRHFSGISPHDLQNNNEPPPIRPRKPPRLIHYAQGTLTRNNFTLGTVENTEYFSLPDYPENRSGSTPSSSEYHSDNNNDVNQDSGGSYSLPTSGSNSSQGTSPPRKNSYGYYKSPAPLPPKTVNNNKNEDINFGYRKALVIYDYNKKTTTEMSLEKSQVVSVLDAKPGAEWWRVKDELGRIGYYPSHYLRMV